MKQALSFGFIFICLSSFGQTKSGSTSILITSKFAGIYSYGINPEKGRVGQITIFPETDSTVLFFIELNRGAPSYSSGALYGRLVVVGDSGVFYKKYDYTDTGCKWQFVFTKKAITIRTMDLQHGCDFGQGVLGDGDFDRKTKNLPDHFVDLEGRKIYFESTKPNDYIY